MLNSRLKIFAAVTLILSLLGATPISAMQVQPLLIEMGSSGNSAMATINVLNDGTNQLPVEISVEQLILKFDTDAAITPADDKWLVFPPQTIIPPGGQQNFRIQWLGDPELKNSESFYFAVKQVPIEMPEGQSGIQLVYNIRALVNVAPPKSKSALAVNEATIVLDEQNKPRISLILNNSAARHAMLSKHTLSLSLSDKDGNSFWSSELTSGEIFQSIGAGLVQPDQKRRFLIPIELPNQASDPGVTISAAVQKAGN